MEQMQKTSITMRQLSAEAATRLRQFKNYAILHPLLQQVDMQLTRAIEEPAGFAFVLLYGPSGVGKTTMLRQIERRYKQTFASLSHLGQHPSVPLLVMETRPPDGLTFNRADYYRTALKQLREHTYERRTIIDIDAENTWEQKKARGGGARGRVAQFNDSPELRHALEEAMHQRGVRAALLDEAQRLLKVSSGIRLIDQFDWLKSMTNITGVLHVLIGTYELLALRNLNGQAAPRGLEIHFPRYQFQHEPDQRAFQGVLLTLLQQVPLEVDLDVLLQQWPYFYERSIGCVGVLKDWLIRAVAAALSDGSPTLTFAQLQEHALPEAQCESMLMEAAAGEQELRYTASRRERLWSLLGMSGVEIRASDSPSSAVVPRDLVPTHSEASSESRPKRRTTQRLGQRTPQRDPVEAKEIEEKRTQCSFSGVIELDLSQADIRSVECPLCGAMRTVRLQERTILFPTHKPRETSTKRDVPLWIKQGPIWTLHIKSV